MDTISGLPRMQQVSIASIGAVGSTLYIPLKYTRAFEAKKFPFNIMIRERLHGL